MKGWMRVMTLLVRGPTSQTLRYFIYCSGIDVATKKIRKREVAKEHSNAQ